MFNCKVPYSLLFVIFLLSVNAQTSSVNLGSFNGTVFGSISIPRNYPDKPVDIHWNIIVPTGLNVYLQIIFAEMADGDSLSIYDGYEIG